MDKEAFEDIKILEIQKKVRLLFIITGLLAIYADNIVEKNIINKNKKNSSTALNIYLLVAFVGLIINVYYLVQNIKELDKIKDENLSLQYVRILGNILFVAGFLCFIYYQLNNTDEDQSFQV